MTITANTSKDRRIRQVIGSYLQMLIFGVGLTWLAIAAAKHLNLFYPVSDIYKTIFEYFGYVCWVTSLGENGMALLTWGARTPAEKLNRRLSQILSLLGVFAFVFSRELN